MTATADLETVAGVLELALYRHRDANHPRDPLTLANEAYERIRRLEAIERKLFDLALTCRSTLPSTDGSAP